MRTLDEEKNKMTGGAWYARRTKNDEREAVVHLDRFCKAFCIDVKVTDDLEFRCKDCTFQTESGKCLVKMFKCIYAPDYKDFGAMGDL